MDLERIKQSFRIRSGRSKRLKKNSKATDTTQGAQQKPESPPKLLNGSAISPQSIKTNGQSDPEKSEQVPEGENDPEENVKQPVPDNDVGPESKSDLPHTTTGTEEEVLAYEDLTQADGMDEGADSPEVSKRMTDLDYPSAEPSSGAEDFDFNPPKPRPKPPSLETLAELLFSSEHLDILLHHPTQLARFSRFLQRYTPERYPLLAQYLETQKAIKAVEYANAVAESLKPSQTDEKTQNQMIYRAASLEPEFKKISDESFQGLVGDALPSFISYLLVKTASECLTNEITGRSTPVMRELVGGLSEVFCLTDPTQPDNPIIYASEEFYRLTRYGPEETLNSNCRFLQGRKTNPNSPRRLKAAIKGGEEISETLLNYKRDGRPFINLLMIAPLHDRYGKLKYHIGAQIDVTGLVEGGRALEGFQHLLTRKTERQRREGAEKSWQGADDSKSRKKKALAKLRDLSESFDLEESAIVQAHSRSDSLDRDEDDSRSIASLERTPRRVYVDSDASDDDFEDTTDQPQQDGADWRLGESGDGRLSGKLPGVYDSFMLFRPAPSMRIVFVSPKLRGFSDVVQTPFLSHVAAPNATITGLAESLRTGVPVSAKIHFAFERGPNRDGTKLKNGIKHEDGKNGRAVWVSCTPLVGADDQIGVWMCVVVEKSKVGAIRQKQVSRFEADTKIPMKSVEHQSRGRKSHTQNSVPESTRRSSEQAMKDDMPIKPIRIDSDSEIKVRVESNQNHTPDTTLKRAVRPQRSVYFDTEQEQSAPQKEVGLPERTEEEAKEQDVNGERGVADARDMPHFSSAHADKPQAVLMPVEEYREPVRKTKAYSAYVPGLHSPSTHNDSGDEYVNTRSPQMPPDHSKSSNRVLIEEDSDVYDNNEGDLDHDPDDLDVGSPDPDTDEDQRNGSPASPIRLTDSFQISSTSHIARSTDNVEDDAKPEENEVHDQEESSTATHIRHPRTPSPHNMSQKEDARIEEDSKCEQNEVSLKGSLSRAHDSPQGEDVEELVHEVADENHKDEDRDSAISIDSPAMHSRKPESRSPSKTPSPPATIRARRFSNIEGEAEEGAPDQHENDIKNWVEDARPPSRNAQDQVSMRMGSGRVGSSRWADVRPLKLSKEAMDEANRHARNMQEEIGSMSDDPCLRSPYSVD